MNAHQTAASRCVYIRQGNADPVRKGAVSSVFYFLTR